MKKTENASIDYHNRSKSNKVLPRQFVKPTRIKGQEDKQSKNSARKMQTLQEKRFKILKPIADWREKLKNEREAIKKNREERKEMIKAHRARMKKF